MRMAQVGANGLRHEHGDGVSDVLEQFKQFKQ